jgi:hypothetical protein
VDRGSVTASVTSWSGLVPQPLRNIIHRKFDLTQLMRLIEKNGPPKRWCSTAYRPIAGENAW